MVTYREQLRTAALENYGFLTPRLAEEYGVPAIELRKLTSRGAFVKCARGVYRDPFYPPDEYDYLRELLLELGDGAYLRGNTVLEVFDIGQLDPRIIRVASPAQRHHKKFPDHIKIRPATPDERLVTRNGMKCQHIASALIEIQPTVMPDRWDQMVEEARDEGLLITDDYIKLKELV